MPLYLGWLERRVRELGGIVRIRAIADLADALAHCPIVVNCTGLGSRELAHDRELYAIRGQLVRVAQPSTGERITQFLLDDHAPEGIAYIVPRSHDVVLGGTAEEHSEDLAPDAKATAAIRARCEGLDPRLENAPRLGVSVGLRPARAAVRLEAEVPRPGSLLVHDYGHGGAGVTLSWGCAAEVVRLVRAHTS